MTKRRSYIPQGDEEFEIFFKNIVLYAGNKTQGKSPEWTHIPKENLDTFNASYAVWHTAYEITLKPHTTPETREKNRVRKESEKTLRDFVNRFLRYAPVTDQDRDNMKIPNRSGSRIIQKVPEEAVVFSFRIRNFSQVIVDFKAEGIPNKARPYGCDGALIVWAVLDKAPLKYEELTRHILATRTPYTLKFDETERGKTVYVAIRWQNNKGQLGPWSPIQSTIVP